MDLGVSGLASGFDWKTFVTQISDVGRAPQRRLQTEQGKLQQRNDAYGSLKSQLLSLKSSADALKDSTLFDTCAATVSDSSVATATAAKGAVKGSYTFAVSQLATVAVLKGDTSVKVSNGLNAWDDVSNLKLSDAAFATNVTAGDFTVNGRKVTIATSDTLQQVFDKISAATTDIGAVTGSYDAASDTISLTSAGKIVLGSANDTSNFLQAAQLSFNDSGSVTSTNPLGAIKLSATLATANFRQTVDDGSGGEGQFKINGVAFTFDAFTDTVSSVLNRINESSAGVMASYDSVNNRFVLTNKATGDSGIALEDVQGNFIAATQLNTGTLTRGKNLQYTINNGGLLSSQSNTITEASSGLTGLSVSVLKQDTTTIQINSDATSIKNAINSFISLYNKTQALIDTYTANSTDAKGNVSTGILASDRDAGDIGSSLRRMVVSSISGLTGTVKQLASMGVTTSGYDNNLTLSDSSALDNALTNKLADVKDYFSNSASGLSVSLSAFLDKTAGEDGALITRQGKLTSQSTNITKQITDMERVVQMDAQRLTASFVAMEKARANITQQGGYLTKYFGA